MLGRWTLTAEPGETTKSARLGLRPRNRELGSATRTEAHGLEGLTLDEVLVFILVDVVTGGDSVIRGARLRAVQDAVAAQEADYLERLFFVAHVILP
jgi:hypothetical protein